jgi:purine nucleosidase
MYFLSTTTRVTGPLTNIAYVLKQNPAAADKIACIWWMGGTLRRPGNIFNQSSSDGSAEWNVFADPQAAAVVWASKVPITLVPLDATNKVTPCWHAVHCS